MQAKRLNWTMLSGKDDWISLPWLCYFVCDCLSRLKRETLLIALKKQAVIMWTPNREGRVAGNCRWPLGTEDLNATTSRSLILPTTIWTWIWLLPNSSLQIRMQPSYPLDSNLIRLWPGYLAKSCLAPGQLKPINGCCFKLLALYTKSLLTSALKHNS